MAVIYTQHYAQFFDADGVPLADGKLYTYDAGTTTPKATFTTAAGNIQMPNPIILDSSGRATFFIDGSYKFELTDANDVPIETTDNVTSFTAFTEEAGTVKITDNDLSLGPLNEKLTVGLGITKTVVNPGGNETLILENIGTVTASKTGAYTALTTDQLIPCNATGGAFTITLYAASGNSGRQITIKKTDSSTNAITIDGDGVETIDGSANTQLLRQNESVTLECNGTGWLIVSRVRNIVNETAKASTSGSSTEFTGIPTGVKRITFMLVGWSSNGTAQPLIQIGDSGGFQTSGYLGSGSGIGNASASSTTYTAGFGLQSGAAANVLHGSITLTRVTGNTWACFGAVSTSNSNSTMLTSGTKVLTNELDRIRIITTDTQDAGSVNIAYEF